MQMASRPGYGIYYLLTQADPTCTRIKLKLAYYGRFHKSRFSLTWLEIRPDKTNCAMRQDQPNNAARKVIVQK